MILRVRVCIPTYNNPLTIAAVAKDCLTLTQFPVLIVDDGSDVSIQSLLLSSEHQSAFKEAFESGRLQILRFEKNQGKGIALQTAIRESVGLGFTHLVALDGDGQHFATEISKLVRAAEENPWDLIIGNRKMDAPTVPEISKFGRKFSNFWVKFQTDTPVADSQSGFRVYPLFPLQTLKFWTRRFDFEIEVMIRLLWRGVSVREVEIDVYYPEAKDRVSHFDKLWDNVRITLLNTLLIVISLLKAPKSTRNLGLAVGVGVWVGCTPLFGLHTLIVAALSFFLRLNFLYLWLGTQISIPPLAPFLAIASIHIGHALRGDVTGQHSVSEFSWSWLLGSMVLGGGLGVVLGGLSSMISRSMRKPQKQASWNGKSRGGVFGNWILKCIMKYLGLGATYFCLYFITPYFYLFAPKGRRSSNEFWKVLRPEVGYLKRQWLVLNHFRVFAHTLVDRVYQSFYSLPQFTIHSTGKENLLNVMQAKQGLILLSAHMGGWDLASASIRKTGASDDFHMLRFEAQGVTFEKIKDEKEAHQPRAVISNRDEQSLLRIRQLLEEGKPVGLMGDRPLGNQFELVLLLGKLVPIDCTPFRVAAACGVPLLFTFGFKGQGRNYEFYATPVKTYSFKPGENKAYRCQVWAQEFAATLEEFIRKYPEQWFNFYPFFSTIPKPPVGVAVAKSRNHSVSGPDTQNTAPREQGSVLRPSEVPGSGY